MIFRSMSIGRAGTPRTSFKIFLMEEAARGTIVNDGGSVKYLFRGRFPPGKHKVVFLKR